MKFKERHIGVQATSEESVLKFLKLNSIDELVEQTIPSSIRLDKDLEIAKAFSEQEWLNYIESVGAKNKVFDSYIGLGYYDTITPPVILRNIFENPGWYTAYTPYQAEISQGRLEALLNFQTMVMDLTGMELANASLLDEATAAAEAMIMLYNARKRDAVKRGVNKFFIDDQLFPQNIEVLTTRAKALNIEVVLGKALEFNPNDDFFGCIVQYPNITGEVEQFEDLADKLHSVNASLVVISDLLGLALLKEPGAWGADVVVGTTQRFGVPVGFGGPHAAYFATKEAYKRNIPGRIIGVSKDQYGKPALRMALQTREQHIKREKATSNICTAQALLAIMASMYAVYHGPDGIKNIAQKIYNYASKLSESLKQNGLEVINNNHFDTITVKVDNVEKVKTKAEAKGINFYYNGALVSIALNETVNEEKFTDVLAVFGIEVSEIANSKKLDTALQRSSSYLTHEIFNSYHSETEMMRYLKRLENKDISLVHSMISLGSCTMKLNAAAEMMPLSLPTFNNIHPFAPAEQCSGYAEVIKELGRQLTTITGFHGISFQPNSGAQGELAGLMVIKAYHEANNHPERDVILIPSSAHGTNPASAVQAGFKVVITKCDENGNIDVEDLKEKAIAHKETLAGLMVTYPSTHGVFESSILEINQIIHDNGGQVYMDGANMNAQVGLTNPARIGADVCHLNLHKTFAIPHGGGGPGMGPICVAEHLSPFLPGHPLVDCGGKESLGTISSAPYSSALILLISYGYIKMLGQKGLKESTEKAILNANYLKAKLEPFYPILYTGENNTVAHEMIIDCRGFKQSAGVDVMDIAKRLIDYGFHAPTVSFPVAGTLMVEPTESESLEELDRFADAMINIAGEINEIEKGIYPNDDNVLVNAPHPASILLQDNWSHSYSRKKAAYPLESIIDNKYWVPVGRVDNAFGDRNLICSCPSPSEYDTELA